jgi:hypothetical protein
VHLVRALVVLRPLVLHPEDVPVRAGAVILGMLDNRYGYARSPKPRLEGVGARRVDLGLEALPLLLAVRHELQARWVLETASSEHVALARRTHRENLVRGAADLPRTPALADLRRRAN